MSNPWLSIPLEDYEGHMGSEDVRQLHALSELFRCALEVCRPHSVAVLGVAGGNGLDQIDSSITERIVGIDINPVYLEEVRRRFGSRSGLELHCLDLAGSTLQVAPVELVHAALIFEHTGTDRALENALAMVAPGGKFSVVLQLPAGEQEVIRTRYPSIETVAQDFRWIDTNGFQHSIARRGWYPMGQEQRPLPGGKAFWWGLFGSG